MNVKVRTIGGGIFSKFMIGVQSVSGAIGINQIDGFQLDINWQQVDPTRQKPLEVNPFDWVLEQDPNMNIHKTLIGRVTPLHSQFLQIPDFDTKFKNFKTLVQKLKIKEDILNNVNPLVDSDTIGVHVRLTDMNKLHSNYGVLTTDSFKRKIEEVIKTSGKEKIFVASDNSASIEKLSKHFDIIYNDVSNRSNDEEGRGYNKYLRENSGEKSLWEDTFLDAISLSKCGELIYTPSNMAIASVLYSNTIKTKHRI